MSGDDDADIAQLRNNVLKTIRQSKALRRRDDQRRARRQSGGGRRGGSNKGGGHYHDNNNRSYGWRSSYDRKSGNNNNNRGRRRSGERRSDGRSPKGKALRQAALSTKKPANAAETEHGAKAVNVAAFIQPATSSLSQTANPALVHFIAAPSNSQFPTAPGRGRAAFNHAQQQKRYHQRYSGGGPLPRFAPKSNLIVLTGAVEEPIPGKKPPPPLQMEKMSTSTLVLPQDRQRVEALLKADNKAKQATNKWDRHRESSDDDSDDSGSSSGDDDNDAAGSNNDEAKSTAQQPPSGDAKSEKSETPVSEVESSEDEFEVDEATSDIEQQQQSPSSYDEEEDFLFGGGNFDDDDDFLLGGDDQLVDEGLMERAAAAEPVVIEDDLEMGGGAEMTPPATSAPAPVPAVPVAAPATSTGRATATTPTRDEPTDDRRRRHGSVRRHERSSPTTCGGGRRGDRRETKAVRSNGHGHGQQRGGCARARRSRSRSRSRSTQLNHERTAAAESADERERRLASARVRHSDTFRRAREAAEFRRGGGRADAGGTSTDKHGGRRRRGTRLPDVKHEQSGVTVLSKVDRRPAPASTAAANDIPRKLVDNKLECERHPTMTMKPALLSPKTKSQQQQLPSLVGHKRTGANCVPLGKRRHPTGGRAPLLCSAESVEGQPQKKAIDGSAAAATKRELVQKRANQPQQQQQRQQQQQPKPQQQQQPKQQKAAPSTAAHPMPTQSALLPGSGSKSKPVSLLDLKLDGRLGGPCLSTQQLDLREKLRLRQLKFQTPPAGAAATGGGLSESADTSAAATTQPVEIRPVVPQKTAQVQEQRQQKRQLLLQLQRQRQQKQQTQLQLQRQQAAHQQQQQQQQLKQQTQLQHQQQGQPQLEQQQQQQQTQRHELQQQVVQLAKSHHVPISAPQTVSASPARQNQQLLVVSPSPKKIPRIEPGAVNVEIPSAAAQPRKIRLKLQKLSRDADGDGEHSSQSTSTAGVAVVPGSSRHVQLPQQQSAQPVAPLRRTISPQRQIIVTRDTADLRLFLSGRPSADASSGKNQKHSENATGGPPGGGDRRLVL